MLTGFLGQDGDLGQDSDRHPLPDGHRGEISLGKIMKVVLGTLAVVIVLAFFGMKGLESNMHKLTAMESADVDLSRLADGTYSGSYQVFPVSVRVEVTVKDHKLVGIRLVEHRHGRGKAAEAVVDQVLEAQRLQVDAVSGATYSSMVILKAIDNALAGAQQ